MDPVPSSPTTMDRMSREQPLTKHEKIMIVSSLLKQVPPEEFCEAFSDLRLLVSDDRLMCQEAASLCALYNKLHFTPVRSKECEVLLTRHNELEENHFFDPQRQVSFKFDHVRQEPSEFQAHAQEDEKGEAWRRALYEGLKTYVSSHYPGGLCSVFIKDTAIRKILIACIVGRLHRPSAFWNGLWKSEWTFTLTPASTSTQVAGAIMVQAHYFEDGNTHLTVCRDVTETLLITTEAQTALDFVKLLKDADTEFQGELMEEYWKISNTHLKAFRRQLPITHSMIDWEKMVTAKIVEAAAVP